MFKVIRFLKSHGIKSIKQLWKEIDRGHIIFLPTEKDAIVFGIESLLGFKLYDWQKAYIFSDIRYPMLGRRTGKTTAHILKLLFIDGEPIHLYNPYTVDYILDEYHGSSYSHLFKKEMARIYYTLFYDPFLRSCMREIYCSRREYEEDRFKRLRMGCNRREYKNDKPIDIELKL